jgi:hypothetical protein
MASADPHIDENIADLRRLLSADPNNIAAHRRLGIALSKQGWPVQAVHAFRSRSRWPILGRRHEALASGGSRLRRATVRGSRCPTPNPHDF